MLVYFFFTLFLLVCCKKCNFSRRLQDGIAFYAVERRRLTEKAYRKIKEA
jgi:hypothetical protein